MRKFFLKVGLVVVPVIIFFAVLLFIPSPKYLSNFMLYSQIEKNDLLKNTPGPRIIFIGGSNLAFGLDCQIVKDSLSLNPINTGIIANIGMKYMLRNALEYIRPNDIVVASPEYQQFYEDFDNGEGELLTMVLDVSPDTKKLLDPIQAFKLLRYVPQYCLEKFDPAKYRSLCKDTALAKSYAYKDYGRFSYNIYGDAYKHWNAPKKNVIPLAINGKLNEDAFRELNKFRKDIVAKGAKLFIAFPGYQDISFKKYLNQIKTIERKFKENSFTLLGTALRYEMPDSLTYDTPYHLTYEGVKLRTDLLIADLKKNL